MQRICKYPLLLRVCASLDSQVTELTHSLILILKELQKATPETHQEYAQIAEAADVVGDMLTTINETKRATDNVMQLFELSEMIPDLVWLHFSPEPLLIQSRPSICRAALGK
jgi:hypothetical protein